MINYPPKYIYYTECNSASDYQSSTIDVFESPRFKLIRPIPEVSLLASANIYFDKWVGEYKDLLTQETAIFFFNGKEIRKRQ